MDRTFTKEIFNHTILLAASVDADNPSVLLAWAGIKSKNESSWRFFLSILCTAIPQVNHPATTIMSDRDKGLQSADNEIAHATRAICVEHLSRNIQKNFGVPSRTIFNSSIRFPLTKTRLQVGHLLVYICSALIETHLQAGFVELEQTSPQAVNYLRNSRLELRAAPCFPGKRYGHNTSGLEP